MRIVFTLCLFFLATLPGQAAVFGSGETAYRDLSYFPKWTGMLSRETRGAIGTPATRKRIGGCKPNPRFLCPQEEWEAFVRNMRGKTLGDAALLRAVNRHLNKARYVQDPINWGVPDFWAHAMEFLDRNGDCEDYAIAKYATLKKLGIATEDMRILVLEDLNLDLAHAVLIVTIGGNTYILDNQISTVVRDDTITHYKPVYSINEHGWWMHHSPSATTPGR